MGSCRNSFSTVDSSKKYPLGFDVSMLVEDILFDSIASVVIECTVMVCILSNRAV